VVFARFQLPSWYNHTLVIIQDQKVFARFQLPSWYNKPKML
jgi:hypothetical protein